MPSPSANVFSVAVGFSTLEGVMLTGHTYQFREQSDVMGTS